MDIKTRIDRLSEQEAKATLFEILDVLQNDMEICASEICPYWAVCDEEGYDSCCAVWLGEAQKGVRDRNFYYSGLPNGNVTTVGNTGDYTLNKEI